MGKRLWTAQWSYDYIALMIVRFALTLFILIATSAQAWACSCIGLDANKTVSEHLSNEVIFVGRPIQSRSVPEDVYWSNDLITRFEVNKSFNRELGATVDIHHTRYGSDCGKQFKLGETQLLMAYETEKGLATSICTVPLPEIIIINYFEKQEDPLIMSWSQCMEEGFLEQLESDDYEFISTHPACDTNTKAGIEKEQKDWKDWLKKENITPR